MAKISEFRVPCQFPSEPEPTPLKIVIVYEGFTNLIRVYETWSQLVGRFMHQIQFHGRAWNFSLLRDPQLRESATRHTAEADIIVVAVDGSSELPDHIRDWIDSWLPRKVGRRDAFVAMLEHRASASTETPALRYYLHQMAERGGMDFFCNADHLQPLLETEAG